MFGDAGLFSCGGSDRKKGTTGKKNRDSTEYSDLEALKELFYPAQTETNPEVEWISDYIKLMQLYNELNKKLRGWVVDDDNNKDPSITIGLFKPNTFKADGEILHVDKAVKIDGQIKEIIKNDQTAYDRSYELEYSKAMETTFNFLKKIAHSKKNHVLDSKVAEIAIASAKKTFEETEKIQTNILKEIVTCGDDSQTFYNAAEEAKKSIDKAKEGAENSNERENAKKELNKYLEEATTSADAAKKKFTSLLGKIGELKTIQDDNFKAFQAAVKKAKPQK